jgi:2'-5' RNA ligase
MGVAVSLPYGEKEDAVGYAFEMYFDTRSEQVLRAVWRKLQDKGLLSPDLQHEAKPHISLCVCDELSSRAIHPIIDAFCSARKRFSIALGFIGTFISDENVIFVAPNMTEELRQIHKDFHDSIGSVQMSVWEYYLPEKWQPHCTMALGIPESAYMEAFDTVRSSFKPLVVTIESIGLIKFRPVRHLHQSQLGQ